MGIEFDGLDNQKPVSNALKTINIILVVIIVILALILISMSFLWTPMTVKGVSMNDTLHEDEHIILITAWYKYTYGDIIVFNRTTYDDQEKHIIKRVIGLPGDYIRFDENELAFYRNGEKLVEDYVFGNYQSSYMDYSRTEIKNALCSQNGYLIEEGKVFVLGDNRMKSNDSHVYGAIDKTQIIGKYLFVY